MKDIIKQFKSKTPKPLYLFHGEESYYIDLLTDAASEYLLEEHEKDFDQTILYGKDVRDVLELTEHAKRYPMMAQKQLIIIKEAQDVRNWEPMVPYFKNPTESTVFILAHKHKKADARKAFFKAIKANGEIFESKKLYENQMDAWIINFLKDKGFTITPKATVLLVESLGTDLGKIVQEIDKLMLVLDDKKSIDENDIERNIGISKDYNSFELTNAIATRDFAKAIRIIDYFDKNPKATHITALIPLIYNFHERLMRAHFSRSTSIDAIMANVKVNFMAAREILPAMRIYPPKKVAKNIEILQEYDLKSKGINPGPGSGMDLMRELVFLLMH